MRVSLQCITLQCTCIRQLNRSTISEYRQQCASQHSMSRNVTSHHVHRVIHSITGCITGQSHNSKSCDTQGAIIWVKSMYILSLDVPPQNI